MAALIRLRQRVHEVDAEYFLLQRAAEAAKQQELPAAVLIQAVVRGHLLRKRLHILEGRAVRIQSCWRGYAARQQFKAERTKANTLLREAYFDAQATHIQRWFRGFWSRKYIHNFLQRKAYLAAVADSNARMRALAEQQLQASICAIKEQEEQAAMARFQKQSSKLHHLLSTSTVAGIYRSPYQALTNTVPVLEKIPLEDQIRASRKSLVSSQPGVRHPSPLKAERELHLAKAPGLSLQASAPYNAVREAADLERRVNKALQMRHGQLFTATVRARQHSEVGSIGVQTVRNFNKARTQR
ncbi:TPA: spermatogenesis-associated protein 17 [Trebouxia sp. C0005]